MFIRDLQNGETFRIWAHDTPAKIKDEEVWDTEWCTVKEEYIWNDVSDSPVKEEYIWNDVSDSPVRKRLARIKSMLIQTVKVKIRI